MAQRKWARENSAAETPGGGKDIFLLLSFSSHKFHDLKKRAPMSFKDIFVD
jgi:hypothetical protein